jgi:hypothetical protein
VVVVVDVVVVVVVLQTGPASSAHEGSVGSPVQVQLGVLHSLFTHFLQAERAPPDKPAHATADSSAHALLPQIGGAALALETKTPAASATLANMTTALLAVLVIVEAPLWPFPR